MILLLSLKEAVTVQSSTHFRRRRLIDMCALSKQWMPSKAFLLFCVIAFYLFVAEAVFASEQYAMEYGETTGRGFLTQALFGVGIVCIVLLIYQARYLFTKGLYIGENSIRTPKGIRVGLGWLTVILTILLFVGPFIYNALVDPSSAPTLAVLGIILPLTAWSYFNYTHIEVNGLEFAYRTPFNRQNYEFSLDDIDFIKTSQDGKRYTIHLKSGKKLSMFWILWSKEFKSYLKLQGIPEKDMSKG